MSKAVKRIICISICVVLLASLVGGWFLIHKDLEQYDISLVQKKGRWYYAEDGKIVKDMEGLVEIGDHLFYFRKGRLSDDTTFCEYDDQQYYVEDGIAKTDYSGEVEVDGEVFYVRDGVLTQCGENSHVFNPSCTEVPYCAVCGARGDAPQGHELVIDSCTEPAHCANCDYQAPGIAGHDYQNSTCTRCGAVEAEKITLKVWASSEDHAEYGWLQQMEETFAEAHPEYNITWVNELCTEGDAGSMVTSDPAAAGNVYMFANDQLHALINAGALTRLGGDYLEQVKQDNSQVLVDTVTYTDGNVYGFPMTNNTWFMYYNKSIYSEEDVKSLDTMLEKGIVTFPMTISWYNGSFFFANGGKVFGDHGNDAAAGIQFGANNGGYETALTMIRIAEHPNFRVDESGLGIAGMKTGEVAACFSGGWDYYGLREQLGDDLGAVQLPTVEIGGSQKQLKAFAGSKAVGVNPHCSNPKAATQFAAFLASVEGQKLRYDMRGVIPAAKALAEDESVKSNCAAVAEINTMANCAVVQPFLPEMGQYWTPVSNFGSMVINGEVNESNYKDQVDLLMEALNTSR